MDRTDPRAHRNCCKKGVVILFKNSINLLVLQIIVSLLLKQGDRFIYESNRYCEKNRGMRYNRANRLKHA